MLAAAVAVAGVAAAVPAVRSSALLGAAWAAVGLTGIGLVLHRRRGQHGWPVLLAMLLFNAAATTVVQVFDRVGTLALGLVLASQLCSGLLAATLLTGGPTQVPVPGAVPGGVPGVPVPAGAEHDPRTPLVDRAVVGLVLALTAAQLGALAGWGGGTGVGRSALVVPVLDVLAAAALIRIVVVRVGCSPAVVAGTAAALTTVAADLFAQLGGARVPLPGRPVQALAAGSVLLFGVAALHPSIRVVFGAGAVVRRPPSASFFGLLPLVFVPPALWVVACGAGADGLPTPVFLLVGSLAAGLCVLRGGRALQFGERLADHDVLTDLFNRRGLLRTWARRDPHVDWSLLFVDVDEFKAVNDAHGHDVGDLLLLGVRDRLLAAVPPDAVPARLGGDEFVVVVRTEQAPLAAAAVLDSLRQPVSAAGLSLSVSASIGIADAETGTGLPEMLTRADSAMYAAKAAGRDTAMGYQPEMRTQLTRRSQLTAQVRQLLGGQDTGVGRLRVEFQPIVELASGVAVGAEALVRWDHPDHGVLPPGHWLGLVNASRLDLHLDRAVAREVVSALARWRGSGLAALPVSLNLTRASLLDPRTGAWLTALLAGAGVPTRLLHVEITEHESLPEDVAVATNVATLREAGIELALDDYGTGYTSLDYLRRFPVSVLKLDRSVVSGVATDGDRVVAGVAAMARTLSLDLVAEGVETSEQRRALVDLGVRLGQGWLFARALSPERFASDHLVPELTGPDFPCPELSGAQLAAGPLGAVAGVLSGGSGVRAPD